MVNSLIKVLVFKVNLKIFLNSFLNDKRYNKQKGHNDAQSRGLVSQETTLSAGVIINLNLNSG